jgi:two-component system nitrogen regulation sensor histidine kinase NtrY
LLIANLIPAIALMADVAQGRQGGGPRHRHGPAPHPLVALFSVIAAVPTVIVAIFASLLLQSA